MKQKKDNEDKGEIMNAIAQRVTATPAANVQDMALRIAREAPTLADLNSEQLEQIARMVMTQRLTQELNAAANLAGIDYEKEKSVFLATAGQSDHTRRGYTAALSRLEAWAARHNVNPLDLTPAQADDFIYSLRGDISERTGKANSPATVRLTTAAVSSFYTFLHRRHSAIDNPFRGTKARPKETAVRGLAVPTDKEVKTMLKELPLPEAAAVSIMAGKGLRAGALPTLDRKGERYRVTSKGKDFFVDLTPDMVKRIEAAGLPIRAPFADKTANAIELSVAYHIKKLHQAGKLAAAYSCHDLRHYAAAREYGKDHDIKRVRDFLNHSSVSTTERYLRSIGVKI
jgi:site-specific recombinase XerD